MSDSKEWNIHLIVWSEQYGIIVSLGWEQSISQGDVKMVLTNCVSLGSGAWAVFMLIPCTWFVKNEDNDHWNVVISCIHCSSIMQERLTKVSTRKFLANRVLIVWMNRLFRGKAESPLMNQLRWSIGYIVQSMHFFVDLDFYAGRIPLCEQRLTWLYSREWGMRTILFSIGR
jgi:hypothetical protein